MPRYTLAIAVLTMTCLTHACSDDKPSQVDCRQKDSADTESCAARGDLYTRKLDCDSSERRDEALSAGCVEESPGSDGYDVCCPKTISGVRGDGTGGGGSGAVPGAGGSRASGGASGAGGTSDGGKFSTGGRTTGGAGGFISTGGTTTGSGGAGGGNAGSGGLGAGGGSTGGAGGGQAGSGGLGAGGAGGAASCTDPGFPTYCPATSEVEAGCWSGSTVCETVTQCKDRVASCPVLGYVPDCSNPGCIAKSQCNLPETDSCTACAEAKCCRRIAEVKKYAYCSVTRLASECVTAECNCSLPLLNGECVAD